MRKTLLKNIENITYICDPLIDTFKLTKCVYRFFFINQSKNNMKISLKPIVVIVLVVEAILERPIILFVLHCVL